MAGIPYTYFYQGEYLNDTQHLTREQHGSYLLLLMSYWQSGKALNNKNGRLAVIAKMTQEEWAREESIYAEFFDVEGDIWHHGRCEFDLDRVRKKSKQASYAGRKSAEAKKGIPKEFQKELQKEFQETPNYAPIDDLELKPEREINGRSTDVEKNANGTPTMYGSMDEGTKEKNFVQISFEQFWKIYPRRDGKKKAQEAFEKALKKTDLETILKGVTGYVEFLKTATQQTAMAVTWLNGERWNDEPVTLKSFKSGSFVVTSPTPTPPRFKASEVTQGVEMPESVRRIALRRAN